MSHDTKPALLQKQTQFKIIKLERTALCVSPYKNIQNTGKGTCSDILENDF